MRSFFRHLRREGIVTGDPTADLRAPRKSQRLPEVLSRDEVAMLLRAPRGTDPAAIRDRAMLELMYACGLRATEAIDLLLAGRRPAPRDAAHARQGRPRSARSRSGARRSPR